MAQNPEKSTYLLARLQQEAEQKKASGKESAARKALYAARSVALYLGGEDKDVPLTDLNKEWVDGYVAHLQQTGRTDNTISNYLRVLLNVCRLARKAGLPLQLDFFQHYFMGNSKSKKQMLNTGYLRIIANADLTDYGVFARTRDVFLLCFLGGGLRLTDLHESDDRFTGVKEARLLNTRYTASNRMAFLGQNPMEGYLHNLSGLAHLLELNCTLTDDSAAEAWVEVAKHCEIPQRVIAHVVGREMPNLNYADIASAQATEAEVYDAIRKVAGSVGIHKLTWYAVRCRENTPDETRDLIRQLEGLQSRELLKVFVPVEPPEPVNGKPVKRKRNADFMRHLLFVNCLPVDVLQIRRALAPGLYVYDYQAGGRRIPSPISDDEMRTFMYLYNVAPETLTYYFPDEVTALPQFDLSQEVEITEGVLAGKTATVYKTSRDKLSVVVRFESMSMYYTAEVPVRFLKPVMNEQK
jgi:transcription antitermination factor NusG